VTRRLMVGGPAHGREYEVSDDSHPTLSVPELARPLWSCVTGEIAPVVVYTRRISHIDIPDHGRWMLRYYADRRLSDHDAHNALMALMWEKLGAERGPARPDRPVQLVRR
jgi:hypothetical protein